MASGPVETQAFTDALLCELDRFASRLPGRTVSSIFFGGGTPSLMPPASVAAIIDRVNTLWPLASDCELTLEANPTSVEAKNFAQLATAGINRVSIGIQALNDKDLKRLGRQHTVKEALEAFETATGIFARTSFDLIYARPGQQPEDWHDELSKALGYQNGHMSLYQLTIEPGTAFYRLHQAGKLHMPADEIALQLFDMTCELTENAGLMRYEISNHARPGEQSRHNLLYWRYGEYAGIGPGAHSRTINRSGQRLAQVNVADPAGWLKQAGTRRGAAIGIEVLSKSKQALEYMMMGLRLSEGISLRRLREEFDYIPCQNRLDELTARQLVTVDESQGTMAVTPSGTRLLDAVLSYLLN